MLRFGGMDVLDDPIGYTLIEITYGDCVGINRLSAAVICAAVAFQGRADVV